MRILVFVRLRNSCTLNENKTEYMRIRNVILVAIAAFLLQSCVTVAGGVAGGALSDSHQDKMEKRTSRESIILIHGTPDYSEHLVSEEGDTIEVIQYYRLKELSELSTVHSIGKPLVQTFNEPDKHLGYWEFHYKGDEVVYVKTVGFRSNDVPLGAFIGAAFGAAIDVVFSDGHQYGLIGRLLDL